MISTQDKKYWSVSPDSVADLLDSSLLEGLSAEEATSRLSLYGPNSLKTSEGTGKLKMLLNQLKSPLIFILIAAGIVTLLLSHYRDAVFIFIAVVVNSALGFWQENKAEKALAELKTYIKQRARVIRDGHEREIDAEEIVPGDIVRFAQGDRVSADARVIFANDFQVEESILTGESLPVEKSMNAISEVASIADQSSMIFAGTLVTQGVCTAIVCRTSSRTELGKIASLITSSQDEKTPLQRAIATFSIYLSVILTLLTVAVFVIGIFSGTPLLEMFLTSVAIAVSAIPEGLPIAMTVILAVGVERMAKRKGVVRKLVAAEALGSTTLILTDKTGTLTMAKMRLSEIIPFNLSADDLLARALLNADVLVENPEDSPESWRMNGRIMETALVRSAALRGLLPEKLFVKSNILQMMPFNAAQKFSASLIADAGKYFIVVVGAPDILLAHASLTPTKKQKVLDQINDLAFSGERVLGVATKEIQSVENYSLAKNLTLSKLSFDGLITFRDPVRPGVRRAIERIQRAGIRTIIMTGDHRGTALAVAKELGMVADETGILDATEIASLSDEALRERLVDIAVISRVTPLDKLRIVESFQRSGEIVAMTGDGVNDAPSIKQADVGIAMGSGTEVSRTVADLVLLDDNFETIVAAIEEGRQILGNIRKVLVYLLSNVADGLILIGGSLAMGVPLPLNALQILWVNFFSDSFPAVAFAFEKDPDALSHKPSGKKIILFNPLMKFLIVVIGTLTSALLLVLYLTLLGLGYDLALVQTFIFAAFGTYTLLFALSVRSLEKSIFSYPLFSNPYLTGGILAGLGLMVAAVYLPVFQKLFGTVPLPFYWVVGVLLVGVFNIVLIEIAKQFFKYGSLRSAQHMEGVARSA